MMREVIAGDMVELLVPKFGASPFHLRASKEVTAALQIKAVEDLSYGVDGEVIAVETDEANGLPHKWAVKLSHSIPETGVLNSLVTHRFLEEKTEIPTWDKAWLGKVGGRFGFLTEDMRQHFDVVSALDRKGIPGLETFNESGKLIDTESLFSQARSIVTELRANPLLKKSLIQDYTWMFGFKVEDGRLGIKVWAGDIDKLTIGDDYPKADEANVQYFQEAVNKVLQALESSERFES